MAAMRNKTSPVVYFIKKYRIAWGVSTALLYVVAVLLLVLKFPDVSNLWVSIFVLASGLTSSLATLSDLLVSTEDKNMDQV